MLQYFYGCITVISLMTTLASKTIITAHFNAQYICDSHHTELNDLYLIGMTLHEEKLKLPHTHTHAHTHLLTHTQEVTFAVAFVCNVPIIMNQLSLLFT